MIVSLERQYITKRGKRKWGPILPGKKKQAEKWLKEEAEKAGSFIFRPIVFSLLGGFILFVFLLGSGLSEKIVHRNTFSRELMTVEVPESLNRFTDVERAAIDIESIMGDLTSPHYDEVKFRTIVFREEDKLSQIAYQNGLQLGTLLSVNGISDIRKLKPGTDLIIPSVDGIAYVLQKNDTLPSLVEKFRLEGVAVLQFQRLYSTLPDVGEELFIPSAVLSVEELQSRTGDVFLFPLGGTVITDFGVVTDAVTGLQTEYQGIDIAGNAGEYVRAAQSGKVVSYQLHPSLGKCVIIVHQNRVLTLYGQLQEVNVSEGQMVDQGTVIGSIGTSVYGKVHHLFFSVKKNGNVVDPLTVLY